MLSAARAIACDDAADGRRQLFNRKNAGRGVAMALRLRDWVSIWFRNSVSCDFTQPPYLSRAAATAAGPILLGIAFQLPPFVQRRCEKFHKNSSIACLGASAVRVRHST